MDRRTFIEKAVYGGMGVVGASAWGAQAERLREQIGRAQADRPNLVFVFADQLRTMSCGYAGDRYGETYAGNPAPHTPNIDQLADESADFREAVSSSPVCAPYRASLFTGKNQSSTGMVKNELRMLPDPDAIGHVLHRSGFQTAYIGKWHLNNEPYTPPGKLRLGFQGDWASYNYNHQYYDGYYYRDQPKRIEVEGYEPYAQRDLAINYMREAKKQDAPFALFLSWGPPHRPWYWGNSPDTFDQMFRGKTFPDPPNYKDNHARYWVRSWDEDWWMNSWKPNRMRYRQVYAAMTASLDHEVGRLSAAMESLGLDEDTIFVFTSDHGEMFGAQGRIQKNIFYEEAARVPFLVRWPGRIKSEVHDVCLSTPDIAPTLLGLMDLPVPASMEGMDLSHVALGGDGPEPEAALMQGMGHAFAWRDGWEWRALRDKQYTYALELGPDSQEYLFDNQADPYQTHNLVEDLGDIEVRSVYNSMKEDMFSRLDTLGDPLKPTSWYRGRWVENGIIRRSATRGAGTDAQEQAPPTATERLQVYPNPFSERTTIRYVLRRSGHAEIKLFDAHGRHIRTLLDGHVGSGVYEVGWDGADASGEPVASGSYFCQFKATDGKEFTQSMSMVR